MNIKNRRFLITCLILGLAACLCIGVLGVLAAGYFYSQGSPNLLTTISCATFPDTPITADTNTQLDQIEQQIMAIRGLQPKSAVTRGFMTAAELRQHVRDDFFKDYTAEDAQNDTRTLSAFGLIEPGFDLISFYTDLYSEQIAGFYDQETKEMYVIQDNQFGGPERMTYAHEYVHALQDQTYDIENGLNMSDKACENDSERCAALSALIEGDASTTESTWYQSYATREDCREIVSFYSNFQSPIYDSAPEFMQQDFLFPYQQGKDFALALLDRGGEGAVDEAFNDPPLSTEQILHPENYPADSPIVVKLPDLAPELGDGWQEIDRGVMGEWYTYLILAYGIEPTTRLKTEQAAKAAAGWGGDAYLVYFNDTQNQVVLVLQTTWDSQAEAQEFSQSFQDYSNLRFGKGSQNNPTTWTGGGLANYFILQDATTTWIQAPDESTLSTIKAVLELP